MCECKGLSVRLVRRSEPQEIKPPLTDVAMGPEWEGRPWGSTSNGSTDPLRRRGKISTTPQNVHSFTSEFFRTLKVFSRTRGTSSLGPEGVNGSVRIVEDTDRVLVVNYLDTAHLLTYRETPLLDPF